MQEGKGTRQVVATTMYPARIDREPVLITMTDLPFRGLCIETQTSRITSSILRFQVLPPACLEASGHSSALVQCPSPVVCVADPASKYSSGWLWAWPGPGSMHHEVPLMHSRQPGDLIDVDAIGSSPPSILEHSNQSEAPWILHWHSSDSMLNQPHPMPTVQQEYPNRAISPVLPLPLPRSLSQAKIRAADSTSASASTFTPWPYPYSIFGTPLLLPFCRKPVLRSNIPTSHFLIAILSLSPQSRNWAFTNIELERVAGRSLYHHLA